MRPLCCGSSGLALNGVIEHCMNQALASAGGLRARLGPG